MARQQFGSSLRADSGFLSKSFDPNPLRTSLISRIKTANKNRMNEHKIPQLADTQLQSLMANPNNVFLHTVLALAIPEPSSLPPSLPVLHHTT